LQIYDLFAEYLLPKVLKDEVIATQQAMPHRTTAGIIKNLYNDLI
jgi:hypothetical protein